MTWAQTYTDRAFDYDDPQPSSICIEDIAHALSMICRFNGHTDRFYSVAEHSVEVANRIDKLISRNVYEVHPDISKWAILHDAAEAYTGDVVAPLKWFPHRIRQSGEQDPACYRQCSDRGFTE